MQCFIVTNLTTMIEVYQRNEMLVWTDFEDNKTLQW
jgi:hypothetical protein